MQSTACHKTAINTPLYKEGRIAFGVPEFALVVNLVTVGGPV